MHNNDHDGDNMNEIITNMCARDTRPASREEVLADALTRAIDRALRARQRALQAPVVSKWYIGGGRFIEHREEVHLDRGGAAMNGLTMKQQMQAHLDRLMSLEADRTSASVLRDTATSTTEFSRWAHEFEVVSSDIRRLKAKIEAMRKVGR